MSYTLRYDIAQDSRVNAITLKLREILHRSGTHPHNSTPTRTCNTTLSSTEHLNVSNSTNCYDHTSTTQISRFIWLPNFKTSLAFIAACKSEKVLKSVTKTEQENRKYVHHSWRHYRTTPPYITPPPHRTIPPQ